VILRITEPGARDHHETPGRRQQPSGRLSKRQRSRPQTVDKPGSKLVQNHSKNKSKVYII